METMDTFGIDTDLVVGYDAAEERGRCGEHATFLGIEAKSIRTEDMQYIGKDSDVFFNCVREDEDII